MKKAILTILCAASTMIVSAQDMNSKRGTPILPEAKDWSIGINATPFLNYFGGLLSQDGASAPTWDFTAQNPLTIVGLCVKDENTAYRGKVSIYFNSHSQDMLHDNIFTSNDLNDQYTDVQKTSAFSINLGAGIQKWRGKGRLKGIYGAEAMIGFGSGTKTTTDYGINLTDSTSSLSGRTTENKTGSSFNFGVRGFIGAEYFFAPKMSVSGEFGWGISISSSGEGETTVENWGLATPTATANTDYSVTTKTGKSSNFSITPDASGYLILHFYF